MTDKHIPEPWTSVEMLLADAARYRWLLENHEKWSWNPTRYNKTRISGFACNGTGYLGYSLEQAIALASWADRVTGANLRRDEEHPNSGGEVKLTDQQLQYLRNQGNEYEQAADEIVELRAERDALRRCLTMDGTDVVGFPSDFNVAVMPTMRYDALMAERDALLELVGDLDAHEGAEGWSEGMRERINAALAKETDRG
jgi:hypothetical protein